MSTPQIKKSSSHNDDNLNWIADLLPVAKPYREMQKIKELREVVIFAQKKKLKIKFHFAWRSMTFSYTNKPEIE